MITMRKESHKFHVLIFFLLIFSHRCIASQPFVTAGLLGQLGNQMFQVAAATSLALDNNANAVFPEFLTRTDNGIPTNYKHIFWRLDTSPLSQGIAVLYSEPSLIYSPIPYYPNIKINGYFASEKHFKHHKEEILALFAPHPNILQYLESKYHSIIHHPHTVSVHLRTYFSEDPNHLSFTFNGREYLQRAVWLFPEDYLFVVFSDNIRWCKENLSDLAKNICFIEGEAYYHDFYLMSLCKHNITSNSTFSWWAAYLNLNPDKIVIAPSRWFESTAIQLGFDSRDITPEDWFVLD